MMQEPPLHVGAAAIYPYSDRLAKKFSAVSRYGDAYSLYRRAGDRLLLPRALCPVVNDNRSDGQDVQFNVHFTPRNADQAQWVASSIAFLKAGHSGISQAFTGFGKTASAMPVIAAVGKKTLVVCTKEDLMLGDGQWLGSLKTFLGLTDRDIGIVRQDRCDVAGKKVVIGLVQSLAIPGRYPAGTFDDFGLIVWDEIHRVAADTFSNTAFLFPAKRRWGLSATPERKDGKETIIHAHIGPIRVRSRPLGNPPKVLHFTSRWTCPMVPRRDPETGRQKIVKLPHAPGRITHVLQHIARDPLRNDLIGRAAVQAWRKKYSVVIFTELLDHIELLRLSLKNLGVPWGDMGLYVGGMTERAREAASIKPIVLTTYRMTSEGTNCPWWSCAIFATPRSDVEQVTGRVTREYPDKPKPLVVDISDLDSPILAGYARSRRAWYRSIGAEQIQL
jgi:superfamily II DNA or RNA helicase